MPGLTDDFTSPQSPLVFSPSRLFVSTSPNVSTELYEKNDSLSIYSNKSIFGFVVQPTMDLSRNVRVGSVDIHISTFSCWTPHPRTVYTQIHKPAPVRTYICSLYPQLLVLVCFKSVATRYLPAELHFTVFLLPFFFWRFLFILTFAQRWLGGMVNERQTGCGFLLGLWKTRKFAFGMYLSGRLGKVFACAAISFPWLSVSRELGAALTMLLNVLRSCYSE